MSQDELLKILVELIRSRASDGTLPKHLKSISLTMDTRLDELGLDSLGQVTLLSGFMDLTGKYLPDDILVNQQTVRDLLLQVSNL